ncbi:unnamed protein product [Phytophthora fragariaefolia]|uniref:Unnamed protein product n=1 Tax=Phytophthora fragariaefolia TaxID=1490495 RepID=A0A9W7D2K8_9STRA|nr:unnamed protein product [Phytophthora fragariaefolia]
MAALVTTVFECVGGLEADAHGTHPLVPKLIVVLAPFVLANSLADKGECVPRTKEICGYSIYHAMRKKYAAISFVDTFQIRECPLTAFDTKSELCEANYHVIKRVAEQHLDLAEDVVAASVGAVQGVHDGVGHDGVGTRHKGVFRRLDRIRVDSGSTLDGKAVSISLKTGGVDWGRSVSVHEARDLTSAVEESSHFGDNCSESDVSRCLRVSL